MPDTRLPAIERPSSATRTTAATMGAACSSSAAVSVSGDADSRRANPVLKPAPRGSLSSTNNKSDAVNGSASRLPQVAGATSNAGASPVAVPPVRTTSNVLQVTASNAPKNSPKPPSSNSAHDMGNLSTGSGSRRSSALKYTIMDVDTLMTENREEHRTSMYPSAEFVVRRGEPIRLRIKTDVIIPDASSFQLTIIMASGGIEHEARVVSAHSVKSDSWGVTVDEVGDTSVLVSVHVPAQAAVGEYQVTLRLRPTPPSSSSTIASSSASRVIANKLISEHKIPARVIILFNPWCEKDDVFMADTDDLNEYVLAEEGFIWTGSAAKMRARPWNFGQFNNKSLAASLMLLSKISEGRRGRPVEVSREMSALVNANDEGGVLLGNWSGDYANGTKPSDWTGSAPILAQYATTGESVAFGQCWVFSGVLTTVLRCLGIPVRSVTTYDSAHDTEANATIDKYCDEAGKPLADRNSDSVWNFHVWNDVWMRRPDLPEGNDGWQAVDATPQELSGGRFATGPASLAMIRNGVSGDFDVGFVTSEVNADMRTHIRQPDGTFKVVKVDTKHVGKLISTKSVGKPDRMDITALYKHAEGSALERASAANAIAGRTFVATKGSFEVHVSASKAYAGSPLTLTVNATLSDDVTEKRTVNVNLTAQLRRYTGQAIGAPLVFASQIVLSGESRTGKMIAVLNESAYLSALKEQFSIDTTVYAVCAETSEVAFETLQARVRLPGVAVNVSPEAAKVGTPATAVVKFSNPLSIPLNALRIAVEGLALTKVQVYERATVAPGEMVEASFQLNPKLSGTKGLVITVSAAEVGDICDRHELVVHDA